MTKTPPLPPSPPPAQAAMTKTPPLPTSPPPAQAGLAPAAPASATPATTAPATPATTAPASDPLRARIDALVTEGHLDEAEALIRPELEQHSERAELHLELGDIFYRRYWRNDTISEWDRALALDPQLWRDPRIATRLCTLLGARWKGGAQLIERRVGHDALPALATCAATTKDVARLQAAAQLAERLGGKDAIDPQLVARRTLELSAKSDAARE
jgi:hypothetical protein